MVDKSILTGSKPVLAKTSDPYLIDSFIDELVESHPEKEPKICFDVIDFLQEMNRGGLFEEKSKVIILRDLTDDAVQAIAPMLGYHTTDTLAFVEQRTLKKVKAYQTIKASCAFMKLESLPQPQVKSWLKSYMLKKGLTFTQDIPEHIISLCGTELANLACEVKKLRLICEDGQVSKAICSQVVSISSETNNYELLDSFAHKKVKKLLAEFEKVGDTQLISLLHFLISYMDRLYKVSIYRAQKRNADEIADLIRLPKFIVTSKYYTALSVFPKGKILKVLDLLNELDVQLRLSKWDKRKVFEVFLLKAMIV